MDPALYRDESTDNNENDNDNRTAEGKKALASYNNTADVKDTNTHEIAEVNANELQKTPDDFAIDLVEKYLPENYADEVKKDESRLLDLRTNHSIDALKQKGELSPNDIKSISTLEKIYGILPNCLTVTEAHDILSFASNGDSITTSNNMSREEKTSILQKREDIKKRKLEYIYDNLAFATNGVKYSRKSLVPDRIEEKRAKDYEISPSGYDISSALEDKAIEMPYIEEYGDRVYLEDEYDHDFSADYDDKRRFYGYQIKEKIEAMDEEEVSEYIPDEYKYCYGGFTNIDLDSISNLSDMVWNSSVNGQENSDVILFISDIIPQGTRATTVEKNFLRRYATEEFYQNHALSPKSLLSINVALNKALRDENLNGILDNTKEYIDKKDQFIDKDFKEYTETAIKKVCENISSGFDNADDKTDFYDQVKIVLENTNRYDAHGFNSHKEYIAKMEEDFENKSGETLENYIAHMGILKLTNTDSTGLIRRSIGRANNLANRIFINSDHYKENEKPSFDSQFVDDMENYLENTDNKDWQTGKEVYHILNLSTLKQNIDKTQNRYKLLKVLLQNNKEPTDSRENEKIAALENTIAASLDF